MSEQLFVSSFDKIRLFVRKDYIDNPLATIVVVHGLSESCDRYVNLIKELNKAGYNVISFDNRGNGRSGGEIGNVNDYNDFLDDVHQMVGIAKSDLPKKVFLLGHSLGGFIVNAYGCKYQDIDGIVSSGAVGIYLKKTQIFRFIPYYPFRNIAIKNNLENYLSHDEEVAKNYLLDPYVNKYNKLNLFGQTFIKGVKFIHRNFDKLTVPILYLHGKDDKIVPYQSSVYLYQHAASQDKQIIIYDGFYHEIFNEIEKARPINDAIKWLGDHD